RAPAARLVAHRHAPKVDTERLRRRAACVFEVALCLALEVVTHPARHVRLFAGDPEQMFVCVSLDPDRPARAAPVLDTMLMAAQWKYGPVRKGRGSGRPLEPRRDPGAMFLGEFFRLFHAAAQRHGEHHASTRGVNAKRVAPRLPMTPHLHKVNLAIEVDR